MALLACSLLALASYLLIPVDLWNEMFREQAIRAGRPAPPANLASSPVVRISGSIVTLVMPALMVALAAGVTTTVFAFFLGDEGRYRQHLAVVAHAFLVPVASAVLLVPLKLVLRDPQATINLSVFAVGFDEESYAFRALRMLDLFVLWGWWLVAIGMTRLDRRRGLGSAVGVTLGLAVGMAMLFAVFVPA